MPGNIPFIMRPRLAVWSPFPYTAPAMSAEAVSHAMNPAGSHPRGVLRWGYFLILNAISGVIAVALFVATFYADGIDPFMRGTYDWLLGHPGVTSMMAFSPLAASLLVGWGYSQRARKRKAAAVAAMGNPQGVPQTPPA